MRRSVRRHGGHESSGDQRRKHPSDDHRPAANAKQKRNQKSGALLDLAALRLLRVASRVGVARWQQVVPIASFMPIITASRSTSHVQAETQVVTQQEPRSTRSDPKIMTAPYSIICHPCPWRCWHCPELNHCSDIITRTTHKDAHSRTRIRTGALTREQRLTVFAQRLPLEKQL